MRVFVSEFICGGSLANAPLPESLRREGRAMLWAIVDDLLRIPDCHIATTLDARLADDAATRSSTACQIVPITISAEEREHFDRLVAACDATLVIAPETDGVLAERVRRVIALGGRSPNCSPESIELCGDKLQLAEHLVAHGLPTIPAELADLSREEPPGGHRSSWVIKPRDGAGSWLTFLIAPNDSAGQWSRAISAYEQANATHKALLQPFIPGEPLSVGCLCHADGNVEVLPIGRQRLSVALFQYQGGTIPADLSGSAVDAIEQLVRCTCATIPGLRGYVGFDLILPETNLPEPLIVEINPRLTTSYVGYRQLCENNIAARWLTTADAIRSEGQLPLSWKSGRIAFDATGRRCSDNHR